MSEPSLQFHCIDLTLAPLQRGTAVAKAMFSPIAETLPVGKAEALQYWAGLFSYLIGMSAASTDREALEALFDYLLKESANTRELMTKPVGGNA